MLTTHRMLLISTGGTIAGEVAAAKRGHGEDYEQANAEAFSEVMKDTVTTLRRDFEIELKITQDDYKRLDSSDIKPEHWIGLADRIQSRFDEFDSFVIAHGTNTLGYTCAALSFALANSGKPIILTGSQVPLGQPGSDAKTNLENAIRLATWRRGDLSMAGVICVFGSHIITGTRVKKSTEFDYDAFSSFGAASIGRIGRIIDVDDANLAKHRKDLETTYYPIAMTRDRLVCENHFETNIASLTEFPGMDYDLLKVLYTQKKTKGFIIRAFGAGDMSNSSHDVLRFLKEREVPVVVTTQAPNGNANLQVNQPGQDLEKEKLAIPTYNMNIESQTAKLMWLLWKKENEGLKYETLCTMMRADMRGEIKVIWEAGYGERK